MSQGHWPELRWDEAVDRVQRVVFRIYAGPFSSTGFVVGLGSDRQSGEWYATLATAWHVVAGLPGSSHDIKFVSADKRIVLSSETHEIAFHPLGEPRFDTALVVVKTGQPLLAVDALLPILPFDVMLARGADAGWLGFPGLVEPELCFFHGHISGYLADPPMYLVDGVAINGVSGGPAFDSRAHLIGMISAYIPNVVDGKTTLPGLLAVTPINAIRYWMEYRLGASVLKKGPDGSLTPQDDGGKASPPTSQ
jgi:hypothetical protein